MLLKGTIQSTACLAVCVRLVLIHIDHVGSSVHSLNYAEYVTYNEEAILPYAIVHYTYQKL